MGCSVAGDLRVADTQNIGAPLVVILNIEVSSEGGPYQAASEVGSLSGRGAGVPIAVITTSLPELGS